ncbi:Chaperonin 10 Kd subunit [Entamoeba marina]
MSLLSTQNINSKLSGTISRLQPTGEMILVQHYNTQSINGIVLPQQENKNFQQGMVVAINKENNPFQLKVGSHILFGRSPAATFISDKKNYSLMKQHDVYAKIE